MDWSSMVWTKEYWTCDFLYACRNLRTSNFWHRISSAGLSRLTKMCVSHFPNNLILNIITIHDQNTHFWFTKHWMWANSDSSWSSCHAAYVRHGHSNISLTWIHFCISPWKAVGLLRLQSWFLESFSWKAPIWFIGANKVGREAGCQWDAVYYNWITQHLISQ